MKKEPKPQSSNYKDLIKERDRLYVSKENPTRLAEIIDKINYFEYGVKKSVK